MRIKNKNENRVPSFIPPGYPHSCSPCSFPSMRQGRRQFQDSVTEREFVHQTFMTTGEWIALIGVSVATLVVSVGIAGWMLVRVPPDYFKGEKRQVSKKRPLWLKILKNIGG